jgi:type II secretory pathway pseudopilin PulG
MKPSGSLGNSRGAVLIEAVVALTVLATVGSAAAWMASESLRAVERAWAREADTRAAARLLAAVSLWPRADLDRHLGASAQGPWRLRIDRPRPTLYVVSLADSAGGDPLLETSLFREETDQ